MKTETATLTAFSSVQTLFQTGAVMMMAVSVLAGGIVSPNPASAALPLALSVLGTFAGLFPASLTMKRLGRKAGFMIGTVAGLVGTALIIAGMLVHARMSGSSVDGMGNGFSPPGFIVFAAGYFIFGLYQSFMSFLKFAAMESVEASRRPIALSWILAAGIPAAFLGPVAGLAGRDLLPAAPFLGCYAILAVILCVQLVLFARMSERATGDAPKTGTVADPGEKSRPFRVQLGNSGFWTAVISSAFGFGLMVMLMSAVPVAMAGGGHEMGASTLVLQWHVLGMYVPSFFSGRLIRRFGAVKMILAGNTVLALEVAAALQGTGFIPFAVSMILLGIGWNFMFVGGTTLLTEQYRPSEKNVVQAANDSAVYLFATASTYGSSYLESAVGWFAMNLIVLPFLGISVLLAVFHGIRMKGGRFRHAVP